MATFLPVGICMPYFTFPKVPSPMVLPIKKSPIFLLVPWISIFNQYEFINFKFLFKINIDENKNNPV